MRLVASFWTWEFWSHVICLKFHPQEGLATKLPLTKYAMFKCNVNWLYRHFHMQHRFMQEKFTAHILKQQEVVAYMSPAEVFVTGIKISNQQKLSLIAWLSFPSEGLDHLIYSSKGKGMEFQSEEDCVPGIKRCVEKHKYTVPWCKCVKCYAQTAEMSCSEYRHYAQMLVYICSCKGRNVHTCSNSNMLSW